MFEDLRPPSPSPDPEPKPDLPKDSTASGTPSNGSGDSDPSSPSPEPSESVESAHDDATAGGHAANVVFEEETEGEAEPEDSSLHDWKEALRRDFERWLGTIDELPSADLDDLADVEDPDLYSFYEQMAAANVETRKVNRRTAEALSQWGDTLTRFDGQLGQLREHFGRLAANAVTAESLPRAACLVLVEILDRMHRLAAAFVKPPEKSWWQNDTAWRQAWQTQRQGFDILVSHLEALLRKEGVTRIEVVGKPFEPSLMVAVAAEASSAHPHNTVVEEVAAGYQHRGELLRAAQVKVTLNQAAK
jgi:molecular chaperone GrpE (heat shock protein)